MNVFHLGGAHPCLPFIALPPILPLKKSILGAERLTLTARMSGADQWRQVITHSKRAPQGVERSTKLS
jgi:hypothetical protein